MYASPIAKVLYYEENYLLGIFILFGIATYLGTYVLSLFIKKAVFAVAAGVHVVIFILYVVGYVIIEAIVTSDRRHATYSALQYGGGLVIPAANLGRKLSKSSLCPYTCTHLPHNYANHA